MDDMEALELFLSPERKENAKRCFMYFRFLKNSEKCSGIGGEGLEAFRNQAASWFKINIPFELKEHNFTEVLNGLNKQNDKEKVIVHTCRVGFRNKIKTFQERYGLISLSESLSEENTRTLSSESPFKHATRSAVGNVRTL